jgi:RNA polymerase sigma-70 factor (ECF subfamily)
MGMVACASPESLVFLPLSRGSGNGAGSRAGTATAGQDVELCRAARRGDRGAFGRLIVRNERAAFGLCLRLLRDPEEARDAAQEAFVRAYEGLSSYDPALPFTPWLLRIARNHCLDLLRRRGSGPVLVRDEGADANRPSALDVADPEAKGADESLAQAEGQARLTAAVDRLPPDQREALLLFHQEQLSYREIAAVLEVPMGTVMTWLYRARQALRTELGGGDR